MIKNVWAGCKKCTFSKKNPDPKIITYIKYVYSGSAYESFGRKLFVKYEILGLNYGNSSHGTLMSYL